MNVYDCAHQLARALKESSEIQERDRLQAIAEADETNKTLLKEYKRLQVQLQMQSVGGQSDPDAVSRFQQIASLLAMNSDVMAYLMSEMRVQQMMAIV